MELQTSADVDLLAAVLNLADPTDNRHTRRIQALGERLSAYMESREHQMSDELASMREDVLTLLRTISIQNKRLQAQGQIIEQQSRQIQFLSDAMVAQAAQRDLRTESTESAVGDELSEPDQATEEPAPQVQLFARTIADQAERIQGLSATVVELMDRLQALEERNVPDA